MSRLYNNGQTNEVDILQRKLEPWINNPPDYQIMIETYQNYGRIKSQIRLLKREIERVEDEVSIEIDKPRSNEAKKAKLSATASLKDKLATLEAQEMIIESDIKALEFMKVMFNASNYRTRLSEQYA